MSILAVKTKMMKAYSIAAVTTVAAVTVGVGQAQAAVLTFDDLAPFSSVPIPNGYGGFNWDNFYYLDTPSYSVNPSGYINGTVSSPNVAFNAFGEPATVTSVSLGSQFDFNSAYLTAAWNDGLNILVEGFLGGVNKYSTTVTVDTTSPTQFNFNFLGIDTLRFTSFGGTDAGYGGAGTHFALDNFTYNSQPVPEPTTILGLFTAASFGVTLRNKKSSNKKAISKI